MSSLRGSNPTSTSTLNLQILELEQRIISQYASSNYPLTTNNILVANGRAAWFHKPGAENRERERGCQIFLL